MEAIWVAAEMRAGGAYAHSTLMLATLAQEEDLKRRSAPQRRVAAPNDERLRRVTDQIR